MRKKRAQKSTNRIPIQFKSMKLEIPFHTIEIFKLKICIQMNHDKTLILYYQLCDSESKLFIFIALHCIALHKVFIHRTHTEPKYIYKYVQQSIVI